MIGSSVLVIGLVVTWVTPLWLVSIGVALGVAVLGALYGVLCLVSPRLAEGASTSVREGILLPIFYLALFLTTFAAAGLFLVPDMPYRALLGAVARLAHVGPAEIQIVVPPSTRDFKLSELQIPLVELSSFTLESDQPLLISTNVPSGLIQMLSMRTTPGSPVTWEKHFSQEMISRNPTPSDTVSEWTATNVTVRPATLRIHAITDIEFPEVRVVPLTALALIALVALYLAVRLLMPKVAAIALTTGRESMSQPLFYVALTLGCFALVAFIFVPYNTFGEDVKMLKDSGLTLIMVLSIIVAVWSASVSVSEEVEGRTALTVLSKPVRRRQFILGKFLGILGPVVVLFIVLGFLFLVTVSYKVVYDSREIAKGEPAWQLCYLEMTRIVPGLVLAFLETVVLASISVALSTRLPMLANLIVCASIYVLGHLVPMLVNSSVGKFEIVRFVGQFIATVLPVLDHFNIQAAVAAGAVVPMEYLGMALLYCLLYTTIAMLLGLAMFEDRDLA
jgi:ABC-type transport system involved in multi-copper enzyme maturation permease subunit